MGICYGKGNRKIYYNTNSKIKLSVLKKSLQKESKAYKIKIKMKNLAYRNVNVQKKQKALNMVNILPKE